MLDIINHYFFSKNYLGFLVLIIQFTTFAQSQYIGLENESNLSQQTSGQYFPKSQIINHHIYVSTPQGIYKKDLSTLNNLTWESFAFNGVPIRDFIKKGNEILANTTYQGQGNEADSLLVYSSNNGLSYNYLSTNHFEQPPLVNSIYRIAQNPENPNEILALHHQGVSKSSDFGITWTSLHSNTPEYQYRFIDYHPLDTETIFYTGENGFFSSYIQASYNSGMTWTNTDAVHNNCTHYMAFHPENQNTILSAGEGRVTKSTTKGTSWSPSFFLYPYLYISKIIYNQSNPNIVYAAGYLNGNNDNGNNDTIYILKSTDGGSNWDIAHQEPLEGSGGIVDFHIYGTKFIFLTRYKGVYALDLNVLSITNIENKKGVVLYPNPSSSTLSLKGKNRIEKVEIFDSSGRIKNIIKPNATNFEMDTSSFANGIYFFKIYSINGVVLKKIIKI